METLVETGSTEHTRFGAWQVRINPYAEYRDGENGSGYRFEYDSKNR